MRQILLVVDVQASFSPSAELIQGIDTLTSRLPSVGLIELHDEKVTPFRSQLGWTPAVQDRLLVKVDQVFIKHGYAPTPELMRYLLSLAPERVLVCGIQTETCVLAAGFSLFDAGLHPTLVSDLTLGSSLDRSGDLGRKLWVHHFGAITSSAEILAELPGHVKE